jgi:hypothetical protein
MALMDWLSGDEAQADLGPQLKNWAAQNRSQEAVLGFSHSLDPFLPCQPATDFMFSAI